MKCPMTFNLDPFNKDNNFNCIESNCAFWVAGEHQECSIKNIAFSLRMINKDLIEIRNSINNK